MKEAKSNTAQYFALLVKSGLIMKSRNTGSGGSSQYTLTRKGESSLKNPKTSTT
jgi:predicted transcriptional regulator